MLKSWDPITVYAQNSAKGLRILKRYFPETAMMGYELQEWIPPYRPIGFITYRAGYWKTIAIDPVSWGYEQGWAQHHDMEILDNN